MMQKNFQCFCGKKGGKSINVGTCRAVFYDIMSIMSWESWHGDEARVHEWRFRENSCKIEQSAARNRQKSPPVFEKGSGTLLFSWNFPDGSRPNSWNVFY